MNIQKVLLTIVLLSIVFSGNLLIAQTKITTESITVRDGLSSNSIRDIIQDDNGYLWIATADGINIYDGYKFTVFKNIPGDTTTIPTNDVHRLFKDRQGTIWIGTLEGLAKYDRITSSFSTFLPNNNLGGSSANWVTAIYEDNRDNLWVGYSEGCVQFDRETNEFMRFDVMLTDNSIKVFASNSDRVLENRDKELFVLSTAFGLLKFDYDAQLFVQIPLENNFNKNLIDERFFDSIFDKKNILWVGTLSGLLKIDIEKLKGYDLTPYRLRKRNSAYDNASTAFLIDKEENIWIGTGTNGLYIYHSDQEKLEQILPSSLGFTFEGFFEDRSGIFWLGTKRGILKYDFDKKPFATFSVSADLEQAASKSVLSFSESAAFKDKVWMGTMSGVYLFDKITNEIFRGADKIPDLSKLSAFRINEVIEQNNNKLWIATMGEGLFLYNRLSESLKSFRHKEYNQTSLLGDQILTIHSDRKDNLWIGTTVGLNLFHKNSQNFIIIPSQQNRKYDQRILDKLNKLRASTATISSIIKVGDYADITKEFVLREDSKVLIYSMGEGLRQWNMVDYGWLESSTGDTIWSANEFAQSFHASGTFKNRLKMGLLDLKSGRYKLRYKSDDSHSVQSYNAIPPLDSTYWGTQIFSLQEEEFKILKSYLIESEQKSYILGSNIRIVFSDSKNNIWVGTEEGVSKVDSNFNIQNYAYNSNNNSLSNNSARDINEDFYGNIWIATDDGLNRFDPNTNQFINLGESEGLPSSNLSAIEVDDAGNLWISGIKGISKVELDDNGNKQIIVNYDVKDGLQGYEFNKNSSLRDQSGKLYFSGLDGFNVFYPGISNKTPPLLALQSVKISNKSFKEINVSGYKNLQQLTELSLTHNQNDLAFEFASIHFSRPDKNRLFYKMDGVDEEWQVGDRRFASYTNLDPGDYTFKFKGSNGDGVWSDEIRKISIHIAAPWYNNWFAYLVYIAIFFGILFVIRKIEMGRQQKNAKINESQLRAEAAESKAKVAEAQALVVQAENERKTKELEEARNLQLSMLPKELPQLPHLDIAVFMQTATEVGGDYYDFHVALDGTLTVVVGDATGHGMKAGTMVTTAKSLFRSYGPNPDILFSFQEITRCIKEMNFGKLSMCMTMLKIKGNKMQISTAGMPPSFIFRRDTRVVEEHLFKAMPLGTMEKFPYEIKDTTLNPGDTILLLSDGLPELKNTQNEMYGYQRIRNGFENVADKAPEDIVSYLKNEGASWINHADPDDDVTFVVIKVK
jgi:ligand-binding sensor domain-containing protein/serine phosphatase RsbU (regulator of sigma subunit)